MKVTVTTDEYLQEFNGVTKIDLDLAFDSFKNMIVITHEGGTAKYKEYKIVSMEVEE